jgi:hypothetical protein
MPKIHIMNPEENVDILKVYLIIKTGFMHSISSYLIRSIRSLYYLVFIPFPQNSFTEITDNDPIEKRPLLEK